MKNTKLALDTRLESAVNIVKKAYSEVSSFDALVEALISTPLWKLHQSCSLQPGFPVTPMLAKPTKSIQEVLKRLNGKRFTCEYKYDGERAQVHMQNDGLTKVRFLWMHREDTILYKHSFIDFILFQTILLIPSIGLFAFVIGY